MMALLLDHLWQSSIFAAGAALLAFALHGNSANVRFWLWFAASMKFLVPFAFLTALSLALFPPIVAPAAAPAVKLIAPLAKPFSAPALAIGLTAATPSGQTASALQPTMALTVAAPAASRLDPALALLALWGLGFLVLITRWLVRWLRVHALSRDAVAMPLEAPVAVKFSDSLLEPGLVGILRPIILLPQGIEQQLSPAELRAVLAHELCHWRRNDNLLAALHMLVEALFWFFPLVWWLGARLNAERERACDESVVAEGNDPELYAEGILKVCRAYLQSPLACVAGVSGAGLKQRIDAIMENQLSRQLTAMRKMLLGAFVSASVIAPLVLGLVVAPLAHVPAQAKATLLAKLNIHDEPATIPAPSTAEPLAPKAAPVGQPPQAADQTPLPVPEAQHVAAPSIPEIVVGPLQFALNNLPVLSGSASAEEPKTSFVCHNTSVTGRAVSPQVIQMPGFACELGEDINGVSTNRFGSCPGEGESPGVSYVTTGSRLGRSANRHLCKFNVTMNVQLADPAEAAKMQPGMTVKLAGNFRVATQNHVDYLVVSNAKILYVAPFAPAAGEVVYSFTCQPAQLVELSKQVGLKLCVQDDIVTKLSAEGPALSTAAHSFTRHPIRNRPVGGPDEITCRLNGQGTSRLPPPLTCARNSYWISNPSPTDGFHDTGPFYQTGDGGGSSGPPQVGYVSGGIP